MATITARMDPIIAHNFTAKDYQIHPGEARTWANDAQYPRQRPIRDHHVDFLAYLIKTGNFRPGTEVALAYLGSRPYVINGNHTIRAIAQADLPYLVTLATYQCTSMDEIDRLYTTYDRQLHRTPRDMLKAYGFADHSGLSQRAGEVLFGSMRLVLTGLVHDRPRASKELGYLRDNERLYVAALDWTSEARQYSADISGTGVARRWHEFLMRQSLMAVGVILYRYEPGRAEEFWSQVAKEDHPEPRHPTRQLAKWFQTDASKTRFRSLDLLAATSLAWNAVYHDRPLRSFILPSTELPVHLEGTPHLRDGVRRYVDPAGKVLRVPVFYDEPLFRKGRRDGA